MNIDATTGAGVEGLDGGDPAQADAAAFDGPGIEDVRVGHGGSMTSDVALFGQSLEAARLSAPAIPPVAEVLMEPLGMIDREAGHLAEAAQEAMASGDAMTPGEILDLTVRSQEFMFHSQLTANIANRTAEGLQQLFRQQG